MSTIVQARARANASVSRRPPAPLVLGILLALLILSCVVAAAIGAAGIPLSRLPAAIGIGGIDPVTSERDHLVLWSIRLPRIVLAAMVGGLLAAAGAVMQGLFRNPLADPTLVGVSSGAALGADAQLSDSRTSMRARSAPSWMSTSPGPAFGSMHPSLSSPRQTESAPALGSREAHTILEVHSVMPAAIRQGLGSASTRARALWRCSRICARRPIT